MSVIKAGVSTQPGVMKALDNLQDTEFFAFERVR